MEFPTPTTVKWSPMTTADPGQATTPRGKRILAWLLQKNPSAGRRRDERARPDSRGPRQPSWARTLAQMTSALLAPERSSAFVPAGHDRGEARRARRSGDP